MAVVPGESGPVPGGGFLRGAVWSALGGGVSILLPLGMFLAFARAMAPDEIGRLVLAVALSELLKVFGAPGFYEAILQRGDATGRDGAAALAAWSLLGVMLMPIYGALLFGLLALLGGTPEGPERWLLLIIALRIPIDLIALQPQAELARRQAYARLATRGLFANVAASLVGIALLALGHPAEGLVAYTLALPIGMLATTVVGTRALYRPRWDGARLRGMWREALPASAVRGVATASNHLDQLLVGAVAGTGTFAWFNLAKRVEMAFSSVSSTFSTSLFQPYFAGRRSLAERQVALRRSLLVINVTCGVAAASFVAVADLAFPLVLGPAWQGAAMAAALMAAAGHIRALGGVHASLLSATGRNAILLRRFAISVACGLLLVALAAPFGATACAAMLLLRAVIAAGLMSEATRGDAGLRGWADLALPPLASFLAMLAAAAVARLAIAGSGAAEPRTAIAAILGAAIAAGAVGLGIAAWQLRGGGRLAVATPRP